MRWTTTSRASDRERVSVCGFHRVAREDARAFACRSALRAEANAGSALSGGGDVSRFEDVFKTLAFSKMKSDASLALSHGSRGAVRDALPRTDVVTCLSVRRGQLGQTQSGRLRLLSKHPAPLARVDPKPSRALRVDAGALALAPGASRTRRRCCCARCSEYALDGGWLSPDPGGCGDAAGDASVADSSAAADRANRRTKGATRATARLLGRPFGFFFSFFRFFSFAARRFFGSFRSLA